MNDIVCPYTGTGQAPLVAQMFNDMTGLGHFNVGLNQGTLLAVMAEQNESLEAALVAHNLQALLDYAQDHPESGLPATKKALLRATGVARSHIARLLALENSPSVGLVGQLAHAYGLQAWELLISRLDLSDPRTIRRLRPGTRAERAAATAALKRPPPPLTMEPQHPEAAALFKRIADTGQLQESIKHELPAPGTARSRRTKTGAAHSKKVPAHPRKHHTHK